MFSGGKGARSKKLRNTSESEAADETPTYNDEKSPASSSASGTRVAGKAGFSSDSVKQKCLDVDHGRLGERGGGGGDDGCVGGGNAADDSVSSSSIVVIEKCKQTHSENAKEKFIQEVRLSFYVAFCAPF